MTKNVLLLTTMIFAAVSSCHKNNVPNYPVDADLKAAFNFKVGSYWIYLDSISGRIDSFYVSLNITQNEFISGTPSYTEDEITIVEKKININNFVEDTAHWTLLYVKNTILLLSDEAYRFKEGVLAYEPLSTYPFDTGFAVKFAPDYTPLVKLYNNYSVGGQNYSNVEEVNCIENLTAAQNYPLGTVYNSSNWFYLCPNVGFIKIVLNQPQDSINRVWMLQRYKVIQ